MNELQVNRTPELIAAEINHIKEETKRIVLNNSIEIGRRLTEAKLIVPHGEWGKWLEEKVDYSKTTANNLMNIFNEYGASQMDLLGSNINDTVFANITYTQAVELLLIKNPEERKEFVKNNDVENMSSRDLKKAIADLKKSEKEKEEYKNKYEKLKNKAEEDQKTLVQAVEKAAEHANEMEIEKNKLLEEMNNNSKIAEEATQKIKEYEKKIKELEERPTDVIPGIDEEQMKKIEEEHKKEVEKLLSEKEKVESKLKEIQSKQNDSTVKFNIHLDTLIKNFENILNDVYEVENNDTEEGLKCKNACKKLINMMLERL